MRLRTLSSRCRTALCSTPPAASAPQAQATLVRSFKRLRGDDAAPGSHSAYRITVRQLEALVRLSEAVARVHLSPWVTGEHVAEVRPGAVVLCWDRTRGAQPMWWLLVWCWLALIPEVLCGTPAALAGERGCVRVRHIRKCDHCWQARVRRDAPPCGACTCTSTCHQWSQGRMWRTRTHPCLPALVAGPRSAASAGCVALTLRCCSRQPQHARLHASPCWWQRTLTRTKPHAAAQLQAVGAPDTAAAPPRCCSLLPSRARVPCVPAPPACTKGHQAAQGLHPQGGRGRPADGRGRPGS